MATEKNFKLITLRPIGRSGSYFLQNLFDGHPNVISFPFPFPFYYHWHLFHAMNRRPTAKALVKYYMENTSLKYLFPGNRCQLTPLFYSYIDETGEKVEYKIDKRRFERNLFQKLSDDSMPARRDFLVALHVAYAETISLDLNDKMFIFLHEHYSYYVEEPTRDFEEVKNIFNLRNHLNSYSSYLKFNESYKGFLAPLYQNIDLAETASAFVNARSFRNKYSNDSYFLKTEDLNSNPEREMKNLAEWIGLEFDPVLLQPTYAGHKADGISIFNPKQSGFDKSGIEKKRWEGVCSQREIALLNTIFFDFAREFQYSVQNSLPNWKFFLTIIVPDIEILKLRHKTWRSKLRYIFMLNPIWSRAALLRSYFWARSGSPVRPSLERTKFIKKITTRDIFKKALKVAN